MLGPFPTTLDQIKCLILAVDYFAKWIEAEPLARITTNNSTRFFKKSIMIRFGIPEAIIIDYGAQFAEKNFRKLMADLSIRHHFTSVEHAQANGQAKAVNQATLQGLKRGPDGAKGNWGKELAHVLWAYHMIPH